MPTERGCRSHMVRRSIENSQQGLEVHVVGADGRKMSGAQEDGDMAAESFSLNTSAALGRQDQETSAALIEARVGNIVLCALALVVLLLAGLCCMAACYQRSRQSKRARVYEDAVTQPDACEPVAVKAVKRSSSFINPLTLFRRPEGPKDSKIYHIYTNPLPVGLKEDEEEERRRAAKATLTFHQFASRPESGIILDPPVFYMQL